MLIISNSLKEDYINIYSLTKHKIGIPIFQRFFDWKEKQVDALIEDILESIEDSEKQIYLLDFIAYYANDELDEKLMLADGQQRIVSLNLLILAINTFIRENNLMIGQVDYFNISYDIDQYNKLYLSTFHNFPKAPFKKIFLKFYNFIKENVANLEKIISIIKEKIYIYLKITNSIDEAFDVFQQINTGGKPLSKDDVILSTIKQFSALYNIDIKYKNSKSLKDEVLAYHKFLKDSKSDNFDTLSIMSFLNNDIVKTKEKFLLFKESIDNSIKLQTSPIYFVTQYLNRKQLLDILYVLSMKGIDIDKSEAFKNDVILPLGLFSAILTMKKVNPGGIIRTFFNDVITEIKNDKSSSEISKMIMSFIADHREFIISFDDFKNSLGTSDLNTNIKKALLIMDVIISNVSSIVNIDKINLEHIYPRKPDLEWYKQGWNFTSEEKKKEVYENIGNYMLLNETVNKSIQNKYLTLKINEYNRIIPKDLSLNTEINKVDFSAMLLDRDGYIMKRQEKIADIIYNRFYLAKVFINK